MEEEASEIGAESMVPNLQKIQSAARHQLGLISDILDLSKIEAGKMTLFIEEFDVAKLINEVAATVRPLVTKKENRLVVECPGDIGTMCADQTKVRQTLFNLISNAAKFTEKGTITMRVAKKSGVSRQESGRGEDCPRGNSDACLLRHHRHRHWHDARATRETFPSLHLSRREYVQKIWRHRAGPCVVPHLLPDDGRRGDGGERIRQEDDLHGEAAPSSGGYRLRIQSPLR